MGVTARGRIGIDLGGTKTEGIVLTPDGTVAQRIRRPTPSTDYQAIIETIAQIVGELEAESGECTIGIGTPGAISPATGRIKNANSTRLNGQPLKEDLESRLGRPVRLANDANCFALSEAVDGAGQGAAVVFGVILGTGVGGGLIVHGQNIVGANAIAGEWGHNPLPVEPNSDRSEQAPLSCYCGRSGCIESWLSGPALAEEHRSRGGERWSAEEIHRAMQAGEPTARQSIERYADRLARALSAVINIVDPDRIVLGGGLSQIDELYELVPQRWGPTIFSDRIDTQLLRPVHGDAGGARGAAWLWEREEGRR